MTPERVPAACRAGYFGKLRLWLFRRRAFILVHDKTDVYEYRELTSREVDELIEQIKRRETLFSLLVSIEALEYGFVSVPLLERGLRLSMPAPLAIRVLHWLSRLGIEARMHRLFVLPAILDMRCEYDDARNAGESMRGSWIVARGCGAVIACWICSVAQETKRKLSA